MGKVTSCGNKISNFSKSKDSTTKKILKKAGMDIGNTRVTWYIYRLKYAVLKDPFTGGDDIKSPAAGFYQWNVRRKIFMMSAGLKLL